MCISLTGGSGGSPAHSHVRVCIHRLSYWQEAPELFRAQGWFLTVLFGPSSDTLRLVSESRAIIMAQRYSALVWISPESCWFGTSIIITAQSQSGLGTNFSGPFGFLVHWIEPVKTSNGYICTCNTIFVLLPAEITQPIRFLPNILRHNSLDCL